MALLGRWTDCGRELFDMSQREISGASGMSSRDAVRESLDRLTARGLVSRYPYETSDQSVNVEVQGVATPRDFRDQIETCGHDVFRNRIAAGKPCARLFL